MASFDAEYPNELMAELEELAIATPKMMGEMTKAGAEVVNKNVINNLNKAFKSTDRLKECLFISKTYNTPSDDGINNKVYFYGYLDKNEKKHPAPLVAMAREYGTSSGEKKISYFRKSFKKQEIEQAMKKVQNNYIKGE